MSKQNIGHDPFNLWISETVSYGNFDFNINYMGRVLIPSYAIFQVKTPCNRVPLDTIDLSFDVLILNYDYCYWTLVAKLSY